jgi:hypothetical protein
MGKKITKYVIIIVAVFKSQLEGHIFNWAIDTQIAVLYLITYHLKKIFTIVNKMLLEATMTFTYLT